MRKKKYFRWCAICFSAVMATSSVCPAAASEEIIEVSDEKNTEESNTEESNIEESNIEEKLIEEAADGETGGLQFTDGTEDTLETDIKWKDAGEAALFASDDQDTEKIQGITGLKGTLNAGTSSDTEGISGRKVEAQITDQEITDQEQTWKLITLDFETDDCNPSDTTQFYITLYIDTPATTDPAVGTLSMGYGYYPTIDEVTHSGFKYDADTDSWSSSISVMNLSNAGSPEKKSRNIYMIYRYGEDVQRYCLRIVRKGRAGLCSQPYYNEKNPANVQWVYDEDRDCYAAAMTEVQACVDRNKVRVVYDSGLVGGSLQWDSLLTSDLEAPVYEDDDCIFVKRAGQYNIYKASWAGVDYYLPVRFTYSCTYTSDEPQSRAQLALDILGTDGITQIDDYGSAQAFAAAFPAEYQDTAISYYEQLSQLKAILDKTERGGLKKGEWDYNIYGKKGWTDNCESAKVDQLKDLSVQVWPNLFGMQDAKKTIRDYIDVEHAPEGQKESLKKLEKKYLDQLEMDYQNRKIQELADVRQLLTDMQREADQIKYRMLADCTVTLSQTVFTCDGTAKTPIVTVTDTDGTVVLPENYSVEYKNNVQPGTASVTITGVNDYRGVKTLTFQIQEAKKDETPGNGDTSGKGDTSGNHNTSGTENGQQTKILTLTQTSVSKTEKCKAFYLGIKKNIPAILSYRSGTPKVATINKNGKITVKNPGRTVITVTAKAEGMEAQTYRITLTIKPFSKLSLKASATGSGQLRVSWKKNKKASGYQIVVASDKAFRKKVRTVTIRKNKTLQTTIRGLKKGKKYYVRFRSYTKAAGGTVYGDWVKKTTKKVK